MICCTLLAGLLGIVCWPWRRIFVVRTSPLFWRPHGRAITELPTFSLSARLRSFVYAIDGLRYLCRHEHNAWIHLAASAGVIGAGIALDVQPADWRWLILSIVLVLAAEAGNTAIEQLCNLVHPGRHLIIKRVKDMSAGAVLLCAVGAAVIGAVTLLPYLQSAWLAPPVLCGGMIP